ncbi:hypothetical protein GCM10007147_04150 [Nocardiopsis kunsanensis]|uniref:Uncharacterized protein n=1 Tax=Nocardiopsis kunsanensis TaxID=141693 RepID=A0A919CEM3_9ACTN|nr:hypothetical protein GCM10007147_04150 [Nocardiopsis kunsanensis]
MSGVLLYKRLVTGVTHAGPAQQHPLQLAQDLVETQTDVTDFGASLRRVRKAWAAVTRVTWWCQPRQVRPS